LAEVAAQTLESVAHTEKLHGAWNSSQRQQQQRNTTCLFGEELLAAEEEAASGAAVVEAAVEVALEAVVAGALGHAVVRARAFFLHSLLRAMLRELMRLSRSRRISTILWPPNDSTW
jgi:hypothetical protein